MRYNYYLMVLCFVGVMQSKDIYLCNDYQRDVRVRLTQGESEISMEKGGLVQRIYILNGKKVGCNLLRKNRVYFVPLNEEDSKIVVQMITISDDESPVIVSEKIVNLAEYTKKTSYIKLKTLFGADVITCRL